MRIPAAVRHHLADTYKFPGCRPLPGRIEYLQGYPEARVLPLRRTKKHTAAAVAQRSTHGTTTKSVLCAICRVATHTSFCASRFDASIVQRVA